MSTLAEPWSSDVPAHRHTQFVEETTTQSFQTSRNIIHNTFSCAVPVMTQCGRCTLFTSQCSRQIMTVQKMQIRADSDYCIYRSLLPQSSFLCIRRFTIGCEQRDNHTALMWFFYLRPTVPGCYSGTSGRRFYYTCRYCTAV